MTHRWLVPRMLVLLGVTACPRAATTVATPAGAPATAAAPTVDAAEPDAAEPAGAPALDEGYAPPPELVAPAPEIRIDWERPAPKGAPAGARTPTPSQPRWEALVDPPPSAPLPIDAASRPCRVQHFVPYDERPLRTVELRYDAAGRIVREIVDDDTDGSIESERTWAWGADGRLEHERERIPPQPSCTGKLPESVTEVRHRYDAHGVWIGGQTLYDGRLEAKTPWRTTTYDGEGRLLEYLVHPTHEPQRSVALRWGSGDVLLERVDYVGPTPRRVERWHQAPDGARYHAQWDGKGWAVSRTVLRPDGQPLAAQHDVDGDGRVDGLTRWRYDERGRTLAEEHDVDGDGDVDERTTLSHDDAGYLVERVHQGAKGTRRETWTMGPGGVLVRHTSKLDDSWVEDVEEHVYDASGREIERHVERHHAVESAGDLRNYVTQERWRGERDGEGRLVRALPSPGQLGPEERVEYAYDCRKPYRRFARRNPLDHPQTAAECMGFE